MSRRMPSLPGPIEDDRVSITFEIDQDTWDLLLEVAEGDDWRDVASKALEAGLDQVRMPTMSGMPRGFKP